MLFECCANFFEKKTIERSEASHYNVHITTVKFIYFNNQQIQPCTEPEFPLSPRIGQPPAYGKEVHTLVNEQSSRDGLRSLRYTYGYVYVHLFVYVFVYLVCVRVCVCGMWYAHVYVCEFICMYVSSSYSPIYSPLHAPL